MKRFPRSRLAVLLPALLVAGTGAARAATPSSPVAMGHEQYAQLSQMQALGTRCGWLEPVAAKALTLTVAERGDWLQSQGATAASLAADAATGKAKAAKVACESPEAAGHERAIRFASWQMRVTWALRAEALLPGKGRPAWFAGRSNVESQRSALEQAIDGLRAKYPESIAPAIGGIATEAAGFLAQACPGKSAQACPKTDADAAARRYATAWVKHAEAYAAVLARAKDKIGAPPVIPN